ncbi:MAG: antiterminator LoaP [Caldicoprobacterales bacterium]|jgi:transcriptional antiterminator NusG|nr:antiterminator LoaP [Clostridiales bacterium]
MQWYALFVKTGQEEVMRKFLETLLPDADMRILIPKRKLQERRMGKVYEKIRTLLPGYVLIKTEMDVSFYYQLKQMPGLLSILRDETEPMSIPEHEIAVILALTNHGDVIELSEVYKEGDKIKVSKGPMEGLEGIIESYDHRKKRLKIRLELLGQVKKVDLGAELVHKQV